MYSGAAYPIVPTTYITSKFNHKELIETISSNVDWFGIYRFAYRGRYMS